MSVHAGGVYATAHMWGPEDTQKMALPFHSVGPGSPTEAVRDGVCPLSHAASP